MPTESSNKHQDESQHTNLVNAATRFLKHHPEFGIIPLLLIAVPILHPYVPKDSIFGPIIYVGIYIIVLPLFFNLLNIITDYIMIGSIKKYINYAINWIFSIIFSFFVIALLMSPLIYYNSIKIFECNRTVIYFINFVWGFIAQPSVQICDDDECVESEYPTSKNEQVDTSREISSGKAEDTILTEFERSIRTSKQSVGRETTYHECIIRGKQKGDAAGIIACTYLLE